MKIVGSIDNVRLPEIETPVSKPEIHPNEVLVEIINKAREMKNKRMEEKRRHDEMVRRQQQERAKFGLD